MSWCRGEDGMLAFRADEDQLAQANTDLCELVIALVILAASKKIFKRMDKAVAHDAHTTSPRAPACLSERRCRKKRRSCSTNVTRTHATPRVLPRMINDATPPHTTRLVDATLVNLRLSAGAGWRCRLAHTSGDEKKFFAMPTGGRLCVVAIQRLQFSPRPAE